MPSTVASACCRNLTCRVGDDDCLGALAGWACRQAGGQVVRRLSIHTRCGVGPASGHGPDTHSASDATPIHLLQGTPTSLPRPTPPSLPAPAPCPGTAWAGAWAPGGEPLGLLSMQLAGSRAAGMRQSQSVRGLGWGVGTWWRAGLPCRHIRFARGMPSCGGLGWDLGTWWRAGAPVGNPIEGNKPTLSRRCPG